MEAYDILYNSHEDDNPADSIIAAISLTCDPEKMVGIEKQHREYDYLCRYEYHVGKNGKKLSIKEITKEREEQLLKYRTIKRATYEANLEKEKNIQAEKKKKKRMKRRMLGFFILLSLENKRIKRNIFRFFIGPTNQLTNQPADRLTNSAETWRATISLKTPDDSNQPNKDIKNRKDNKDKKDNPTTHNPSNMARRNARRD